MWKGDRRTKEVEKVKGGESLESASCNLEYRDSGEKENSSKEKKVQLEGEDFKQKNMKDKKRETCSIKKEKEIHGGKENV